MNYCVVGLQWGDEGKGKVVDILAEHSDIVVRYGGGANAGHTVVVGDSRFALHLLPSGSVRPDTGCVIANGVVVDPDVLIQEIDTLAEKSISLDGRLLISENAHIVLDYHKQEDRLREESLAKNKLGTTIRGIGPCYADKVGRSYTVRMGDFRNLETLKSKLRTIVEYKNKIFKALYNAEPMDADEIFEKCKVYAGRLLPFTTDTTEFLHKSIAGGKSLLFEGAQGSLLDLDHGTFPFVTSSNSSSLGMSAGCGVPAKFVDKFIGVIKAYTTRVGAGPFPAEQDNETGQYIRDKGNEYGTTTGRPRRCGWLDIPLLRDSIRLNGLTGIALTKMDVLGEFDTIRICTAYQHRGRRIEEVPSQVQVLKECEPVYEDHPGWKAELRNARSFQDLPPKARHYVRRIEELTETKVTLVSVGEKRAETILRRNPFRQRPRRS